VNRRAKSNATHLPSNACSQQVAEQTQHCQAQTQALLAPKVPTSETRLPGIGLNGDLSCELISVVAVSWLTYPSLCNQHFVIFFFTICTFVTSSSFQTALPLSAVSFSRRYSVCSILKSSLETISSPSPTLCSTPHPCVLTPHNV
jgi:hypothetical protein